MGWKESPPTFSMATKTTADLANAATQNNEESTPHRLDQLAESPIPEDEAPPVVDDSGTTTKTTTMVTPMENELVRQKVILMEN